jgi:triosephosphate isomerase (TIM)
MSAAARRPLVAGNWKMNLTESGAVDHLSRLLPLLQDAGPAEVAVAPAFPCLRAVADRLAGSEVSLAAQDIHWEEKGAYTGEVAPAMLSELGVRLVLVGHSERRSMFGDTDERVRRKVDAVRRHDMIPVLCVGERESERDEGRTLDVVERQLRLGLAGVRGVRGEEVVVAYEPVWAIGTGRTATPEQVNEVHRMVREQLGAMYGNRAAAHVRILYGGSVTPANAAALLSLDEVDGALVGGASLDAEGFTEIVRSCR